MELDVHPAGLLNSGRAAAAIIRLPQQPAAGNGAGLAVYMIRLHRVSRSYEGQIRLQADDLLLSTGLTLLVGRNGSGKSTLLRLLATADFPDAGEISYREGSPREQLPLIRSRIGYVPSDVELHEDMTPLRLLKYMCLLKGADPVQADRLLGEFELLDVNRKRIGTLSQGMQQRLAICQALLGSPRYLLLDEPLNYLDSFQRKAVTRILYRHARSCVIVVAAHELSEWNEADQLLWLDEGRPAFYGTPQLWRQTTLRVWQGILPADARTSWKEAYVMVKKPIGNNDLQWRVFGRDCPGPGFEEVGTTIEDAYFIRSRRLE
ncbi:ABC transporter ATP-binding protein [Paenibacillus lutrae]